MYFDRFDICAAYYHFAKLAMVNPARRRKALDQLNKLRYRPGLSDRNLATISPNAKAIYMNLVSRYV